MRAEDVREMVVLGAGTMGHGIAQVAAMAGCRVRIRDLREDLVELALNKIKGNLDEGVRRGKVSADLRDQTMNNLRSGPTDMASAQLVVEAVPEDAELKRRLLADIARQLGPATILATNTSSLPVSALAGALPDPSRFIGMHFFNPPHLMRLVEIIVGEKTSPGTVELIRGLVSRFGKQGIVVRDSPGFATSRLGLAIGLEAMRMLEDGVASARDIDTAMELGYNHPMGPLKLTDLVGLDVRLGISEILAKELDPVRFAAPEILRTKVARGKLGRKSGEGFYRWTDDGPQPVD